MPCKILAPMMAWLAIMFLSCSYGAEIRENLLENLWSLSAQKYFWFEEPEILKKILNGFLPVRANEPQMTLILTVQEH